MDLVKHNKLLFTFWRMIKLNCQFLGSNLIKIEDSNGNLNGMVINKKVNKISNALFEISSDVTPFKQNP